MTILSPPPDPEWIREAIRDAERGNRRSNVCYDSRCNHGISPHPKLADCPWFGREPSDFGFSP